MSTSHSDTTNSELSLTSSDIYRASDEGVLLQADAERLVQWGYEQRFNRSVLMEPMALAPEQRKGFNLVTVAYYFGAMLMISACAWFLGLKCHDIVYTEKCHDIVYKQCVQIIIT